MLGHRVRANRAMERDRISGRSVVPFSYYLFQKDLSPEQRAALTLRDFLPVGWSPDRLVSPAPTSPSIQPEKPQSRAIRDGWALYTVQFDYQDEYGCQSSRLVSVHAITGGYLKGECHDRKAERTFKVDRIVSHIVNVDTGEILSAREFYKKYE